MRSTLRWLGVLLLAACAASTYSDRRRAEKAIEAGRLDEAVATLEKARERAPNDPEALDDLGKAYYQRARKAGDEGRQQDYWADLERAQNAWLDSLRADPESPSPHTWMGIASAYQGQLDSALRSFNNARKLDELNPIHYTNIAQIYIYKGDLTKARRWLEAGKRRGAPPPVLELNEVLAAWKAGDEVEARDVFETAYALNPKFVNTWDEAPVSRPIESFNDFTAYCCSNPACGPYMTGACKQLELDVEQRKVSDDLVRQELQLEMERRRKLSEIYRGRKDLEIEVEPEATEKKKP
jgi:Flp pilus assembly protein TadD